MGWWNDGTMIMITERKNINRGYKKLRVWQDALELYVLSNKIFIKLRSENIRLFSNATDAAQSISRNIAEGYCKRSIKEYLVALNYLMGSCGEWHSCYFSFYKAQQIPETEYEELDELHYKVENQLIKLIQSLQVKQKEGSWSDNFIGLPNTTLIH